MNRPVPTKKTIVDKSIVEVPISSVKLWKDNPRRNDAAAPKLAEILKVRGQVHPIVVCKKTGICYAGNTRLKAAKLLGWQKIKVLYVDFPSVQAAIAFGIADNKSSEFSAWDEPLLDKLMSADVVGFPASLGYTQAEVDNLKKNLLTSGFDDMPGEYDEETDEFVIKIAGIIRADKDKVLNAINIMLKRMGMPYEANAF